MRLHSTTVRIVCTFTPFGACLLAACASSGSASREPAPAPPRVAFDARWEDAAQELVMLHMRDRALRRRLASESGASPDPAVAEELKDLDEHNTARLRQIIEAYGWPQRGKAGDQAAEAAWALLRRADSDPAFQRRMVDLVAPLVDVEGIPRDQYDQLRTRIAAGASGTP